MKTILKQLLPPIFVSLGLMAFNLICLIFASIVIKAHPWHFVIQLISTLAFPILVFLVMLNVQYLKIVRMLYDESVKLIKNLVTTYFKNRKDGKMNVIETFEPWLLGIKNSTARRLVIHFLMKIPFEHYYDECEKMAPSENDVEYIISLTFLKIDTYVKDMLSNRKLKLVAISLAIFNVILSFYVI